MGKSKKKVRENFWGGKNFVRGAIFGKIKKKKILGGNFKGEVLCWGAHGGGGMLGN